MAIHYRTQGIFIKKSARGEADELYTIYTKDFGKLRILGRAIRKISSKLKSGAGLFYLSEIEFIQGKNSKTLTDAILINKFPNFRQDLSKLAIAHRVADILDELAVKEEKDGLIWGLLVETFERLGDCKMKAKNCKLVYYYFFWNLVSTLGYRPEISGCSIQRQKINCDIIKIIKVILKKDWHILSRLKLEPVHQVLLKSISRWYNNNVVKTHEE